MYLMNVTTATELYAVPNGIAFIAIHANVATFFAGPQKDTHDIVKE